MSEGPSRDYHLKGSEGPADGVERIARERIENALDEVRGAGSAAFAESVHEARKDLKKVRSVLRLVRDELGEEVYRRENDRFRDAGRLLSGARDAEVKLETIDILRDADDEMPTKATLRKYIYSLESERDEHSRAGAERRELTERFEAELEAGRAALGDWSLDRDGWDLVGPGLARSYRRGRNRFGDVREDPNAENVHAWRKRVKDLWYHLRILKQAWPSVIGETADEAHELADLLGDHHDLAVLAEDARGRPDRFDSAEDLGALLGAAERRQEELLGEALGLGARIYAEKPKAFAGRYESYWSAWRAG
ncbi:MAG TPA: CHAD domain-containing protein [Solirubrobacterales bacterium]